MNEDLNSKSNVGAATGKAFGDQLMPRGTFDVYCYGKNGNLKWHDRINNLVVNVGKNLMLDTTLTGSNYTTVGPYMGLVGSSPSPASTDTMSSHVGWTEVGNANNPTYTGTRQAPSWSAASLGVKATSTAVVFSITSSGTVGGCFMVTGSGASSAIDSTTGTLFSCGAFTGGNKTVSNGDQINVTYNLSV